MYLHFENSCIFILEYFETSSYLGLALGCFATSLLVLITMHFNNMIFLYGKQGHTRQFFIVCLHVLLGFFKICFMLLAMTYNFWVIMSLVLSFTLHHFYFNNTNMTTNIVSNKTEMELLEC